MDNWSCGEDSKHWVCPSVERRVRHLLKSTTCPPSPLSFLPSGIPSICTGRKDDLGRPEIRVPQVLPSVGRRWSHTNLLIDRQKTVSSQLNGDIIVFQRAEESRRVARLPHLHRLFGSPDFGVDQERHLKHSGSDNARPALSHCTTCCSL